MRFRIRLFSFTVCLFIVIMQLSEFVLCAELRSYELLSDKMLEKGELKNYVQTKKTEKKEDASKIFDEFKTKANGLNVDELNRLESFYKDKKQESIKQKDQAKQQLYEKYENIIKEIENEKCKK